MYKATRDVDGERWSAGDVLRPLVRHERLHYRPLVRLLPTIEVAVERGR